MGKFMTRQGGSALRYALVALAVALATSFEARAATVNGTVSQYPETKAISAARVTLFTPNLKFFREVRSDANGAFQFENVPGGTYQIGASAAGRAYSESALTVSSFAVTRSIMLGLETEGGRWSFIGNTAPELIDGTGSGTILPTGEMLMCHDTLDPVAFEPLSRSKWLPPGSGSAQGCHIPTLLADGRLLLAGGSAGGNPQDPVLKTVKLYQRVTNNWTQLAPMNIGRWYPGIVRLPDERLMVLGGELDNSGFGRTDTCEIYNPADNTWTLTGSFDLPTEIPPTVVLRSGEILKTWRYPELYNIATGLWRSAPALLQRRKGAAEGGHCDHEIVHLPDGRVMAVGVDAISTNANTRFCEFYDPAANSWSLGPSPQHLRTQPEALLLPDGKVLAYGGTYSGLNPASLTLRNAGQVPNCTNVADLFDPETNQWRAVVPLNRYIHYHNVSMLLADGRVMNTGGAGGGSLFGDDNRIEAYEPPYLFRGVRPRIDNLSTTDLVLGGSFNMDVSFTSAVTKVVLLGTRASTHWVDGGTQCYASLAFTQTGSRLNVTIPNDAVSILPGFYYVIALVDDIPSVGRIVRVTASAPALLAVPNITITASGPTASEGGITGAFTFTRSGNSMPFTVAYKISGSSDNGADFGALLGYVTFAAGQSAATINIPLINDTASEATELLKLTLYDTAAYRLSGPATATITLLDNEPPPLPLALGIDRPASGQYQLTVTGPATRSVLIERSIDLQSWEPLTTMVNITGSSGVIELMIEPERFFRMQMEP